MLCGVVQALRARARVRKRRKRIDLFDVERFACLRQEEREERWVWCWWVGYGEGSSRQGRHGGNARCCG